MSKFTILINTDKKVGVRDMEQLIKDCIESCGIKTTVKVVQKSH